MHAIDFVVARDDLQQSKVIETQLPDAAALPDEALLVKVTRFALTANNITYAVLGDQLKYWQLFPAPAGFGNIPVWGFGEVIASKHPNIALGEQLFGYFPMATHLVIEAADVSKRGLRDGAAHRQGVAPVYNAYARVTGDPAFAGRQGDYQALLRPLFMLSFLVDDYLAEQQFFGARRVMLSSASSKTAFGLAHLLHARGIAVTGLTSAANVGFVSSLGCYDEVVTYDRVASLPADTPVAFVDMAGNSSLREALHRHFGREMKYSGRVGLTHRSSSPDEPELPGARPTWFFAPDQIRKRAKEWGPGGLDTRFGTAWSSFAPNLDRWLKVTEGRGPELAAGQDHPGALDDFAWPVTREQALEALYRFVDERLPRFGRYQDAMWPGEPWLYHAHLAAALNLKLIHPREAVAAAEAAYHAGRAPLTSVEGFVRQILGWREYVRGIYWTQMPAYLERNALDARADLPEWYWSGETDMACLRDAITQTLQHGYAHHIQRLMVTGLFALLYGVQPQQVHAWYLSVYVDAVEWVELPNTLGMSQFGDLSVRSCSTYHFRNNGFND